MIDYKKRSCQKELLDNENIPFEAIQKNMQELNVINTWLGGHAITIKGLKDFITKDKTLTVCEIGCGGGDNLVAIRKWSNKNGISINLIGVDINQSCINFAVKNNSAHNIKFYCSDYKEMKFDILPDVIFSSLFCHHFTDDQLIEILKWKKDYSIKGFFINDLQRHPVAYNFIKILTAIFSKSYLVKNDAPISVLRAFKKTELKALFLKANINNYKLQWCWAYRYLIIHKK